MSASTQPIPAAPKSQPATYALDSWTLVLGLFGLGNLANGAWMLAKRQSGFTDASNCIDSTFDDF